ncbi:MAG: hypothetical protein AVDCRST_MAG19-4600, partial [uncultured Thermomicrobiales bacterium]
GHHPRGRRDQAQRLPGADGRRPRRRRQRAADAARRQAGALQDPGRGGAALLRRTGGADRHGRALRARVAGRAGRGRLRRLRPRRRPLRDAPRAGDGPRRRGEPRLPRRPLRVPLRDDGRRAEDPGGVPHRGGRRLARAPPLPLQRHRALLPHRLPGAPGRGVAARPRRRRRQAGARRHGRRRRLRPRRLHDHHGGGVPELPVRRVRLPRRLDRAGAGGGGGGRGRRPGPLRGRRRQGVPRRRLRPGDLLRLPPRHGRSRGRGPARPGDARPRRDVADRRAVIQR